MAKQATKDPAAAVERPKRKVLRRLKETQVQHEKAERKVGRLRMRLERAEARLAKRAQHLLLVQAKLHPAAVHAAESGAAHDGTVSQEPAEESMPVIAAVIAPTSNGDARPAPARPAKPPRPRSRRTSTGSGAAKSQPN